MEGFSNIYQQNFYWIEITKFPNNLVPSFSSFFFPRYRAVASWSRVQGIGIPLVTAIEIVSIWILSFILAIPEAIGFVMVPFEYKGAQHRTCMLNATSKFMEVWIV